MADRTGDFLRVVCPQCGFKNEFPELHMVYIFLCHDCGEPVAVDEPVQ
jgi:DNA-directed RNA polymerase subunit RPC12/RpoP